MRQYFVVPTFCTRKLRLEKAVKLDLDCGPTGRKGRSWDNLEPTGSTILSPCRAASQIRAWMLPWPQGTGEWGLWGAALTSLKSRQGPSSPSAASRPLRSPRLTPGHLHLPQVKPLFGNEEIIFVTDFTSFPLRNVFTVGTRDKTTSAHPTRKIPLLWVSVKPQMPKRKKMEPP